MINNLSLFQLLTLLALFCLSCQSEKTPTPVESTDYPKALVNYDDYKSLVAEVEAHRKERLIDLNTFLEYSRMENTIILDTRSNYRFGRKHLNGATHLAFTEFTQKNLKSVIPNDSTRILIYCNNNFGGDQVDFESKVYTSSTSTDREFTPNKTPRMLALNIPTFLNLYGYGYKNIYELDEFIKVTDSRIKFKGSQVIDYSFPETLISKNHVKQPRKKDIFDLLQ